MAEDIWRVEYNRDYGAELPVYSHAQLGRMGLEAWHDAATDEERATHETQIGFYWRPSGHVTDSEREAFRGTLLDRAAAYGEDPAVAALLARLTSAPLSNQ